MQRAPERHKMSGVENLNILELVCSEIILESSQQSDSNTLEKKSKFRNTDETGKV